MLHSIEGLLCCALGLVFANHFVPYFLSAFFLWCGGSRPFLWACRSFLLGAVVAEWDLSKPWSLWLWSLSK